MIDVQLEIYSTRDDWLDDRRSGAPHYSLGSTDVAAIFGVYFYGPWHVWASAKRPELLDQREPSEAMLAGLEWEAHVLRWYGERIEPTRDVVGALCRVSRDSLPWLRVSPDALVGDDGGVEVKCPRSRKGWGDEAEFRRMTRRVLEHVPGAYALQVNAQLLASGRAWWDLVAFFGPHDVRVYRFHRDEAYLAQLARRLSDWRGTYLLGDAVPTFDDSQEARRFVASTVRDDTVREAGADEVPVMAAILDARAREQQAKADKQTLTTHLLALMGEARTIYVDGVMRATVGKNDRLTLRTSA